MIRGAPINPDARITPNPVAGDPRPFDVAGVASGTRLATTGPSAVPAAPRRTSRWSTSGATWSRTPIRSSRRMVRACSPATTLPVVPVSALQELRLPAQQRADGFQFHALTNPFTGEPATNDVEPNKRPRSSMTPAMIFNADGDAIIAYGSPGGATIINSVFNVTLNLLDHGMSVQDAIDAPRISVTAAGGAGRWRSGFRSRVHRAGRARAIPSLSRVRLGPGGADRPHTGKQYRGGRRPARGYCHRLAAVSRVKSGARPASSASRSACCCGFRRPPRTTLSSWRGCRRRIAGIHFAVPLPLNPRDTRGCA